jgi:hypothetical protein
MQRTKHKWIKERRLRIKKKRNKQKISEKHIREKVYQGNGMNMNL